MAIEASVPTMALTIGDARQRVVEVFPPEMAVVGIRVLVGWIETGELKVANAASEYLSSR